MKVRDVMSRHRHRSIESPGKAAADRMAKNGIGYMPVKNGDRLVGVLTDRDIAIPAPPKWPTSASPSIPLPISCARARRAWAKLPAVRPTGFCGGSRRLQGCGLMVAPRG